MLTVLRGRLSAQERRAYISAVKCIRRKPSLACPLAAGARNHFDHFQALHIKQAIDTHFTGLFLPWHRYFTWAYERALRECGYEGYQPYWEWSAFASNPTASPVFDGSDTSMSGNGEKVPHDAYSYIIPHSPNITLTFPPQDGGGCLIDGPFANFTVGVGPLCSPVSPPGLVGSNTGLEYNPQCLTRDLGPFFSDMLDWDTVTATLDMPTKFLDFQRALEYSAHAAGHATVGGLLADFYSSPGVSSCMSISHLLIQKKWETSWQL